MTSETYDWCSGSGILTEPYLIENVTINTGGDRGIQIRNSDVYFRIKNCTIRNGDDGIRLLNTNNGQLIDNNISDNNGNGITLGDCDNILVSGNKVNNNVWYGIFLVTYSGTSNYNKINENIINNNNQHGIYLYSIDSGETCSYNDIWNNIVNNNQKKGIYLHSADGACNNNDIWNNMVNNNKIDGIYLSADGTCRNNNIKGNIVNNNSASGIRLYNSKNNYVLAGNIVNNSEYGIQLFGNSSNNGISENYIINCSYYGILLESDANNNILYNNTFIENTINALDSGVNNQWDNGSIGNYWHDYSGVDANDDGIGDIPYDVPPAGGSLDNFPIYEDGNDIGPTITINSPKMNQIFGANAPEYEISVFELYSLDITWYTIDGGITNYSISEFSGSINQTAWEAEGNGSITVRFYANDTMGKIGFAEVTVRKEIFDDGNGDGEPSISGYPIEWTVIMLLGCIGLVIIRKRQQKTGK